MSSVLLLGDVVLDRNYEGETTSLAPEAPVPVVDVETTTSNLGGIGNVVRSLINFCDKVHFLTSFCENDGRIIQELLDDKISYKNFSQDERKMVVINRVVVRNQLLSRFDYPSKTCELSSENEDKIIDYIKDKILKDLRVVVLSDYDRGFLTHGLCTRVIDMCKESGVTVLVDPILPDWSKFKGATLIKPNREEANRFLQYEKAELDEFAVTALEKYKFLYVLNTLDKDGMVLYYQKENKNTSMFRRECAKNLDIVDVNGCGDALITAIAVFLLRNGSLENQEEDLVKILTEVGRIAVGVAGCYILNFNDFKKIQEDRKVVFTNGCFDVIHVGHLKLLNYCRGLGDKFVIGINSDNSIKSNKGNCRPINNLGSRIKFLRELNIADEIIAFEEETPIKLIKEIRPDILVKGADYCLENVVGREIARETILFPLEVGVSSSSVIQRIKNIYQNEV